MNKSCYWIEAVQSSLAEHGVEASYSQIKHIAEDVMIAIEQQSLAFHVPENPLIDEARKALPEWIETARELTQMLKMVEWELVLTNRPDRSAYCPLCGEFQSDGHANNCLLGKTLEDCHQAGL